MKLFSSILASVLVFHLVHSIVIKINPIRIQVRPNQTTNTSCSAGPFPSEISAQLRTTTDKFVASASAVSGNIARNQVATNQTATKKSFGSRGSAENETSRNEMVTQPLSGTESSDKRSTTSHLNVTKYSLVTESSVEYQVSRNQIATVQPDGNVSTVSRNDSSSQYSNFTESLKVGSSCRMADLLSSRASKGRTTPQNGTNEPITKRTSTLSSINNTSYISPEVTTEANSEDLAKGIDNADEISSFSSSYSISTNSGSSVSDKFDFSVLPTVSSSTTVDSEVQISGPQSVKTATPHSEGYPDLEKEIFVKGPPPSHSTLQDETTSGDDKINQEANEITPSSVGATSHGSSDSVSVLQPVENTSAGYEIASSSITVYSSIENITKCKTNISISSTTKEPVSQETIAESTKYKFDSSQSVPPENLESDREMQTSGLLQGEEDQIVSTIESYSFPENVTVSRAAENEISTSAEANDNLTMQRATNISTEIGTTGHIQETTRPNQLEQISSTANISVTAESSTNTQGTSQVEMSNNQSYGISTSSFSSSISIPQSSAANISENYTTDFHKLMESSRTTDFRPDNVSSSGAASRQPICKTSNASQSWCQLHSCKTVLVHRTSSTTSRALTEEEKKLRRLTISNKNPNLAKKLTKVTPLKGNISSNAGFLMVNRKYGARLFFWFVRSLHNTTHAPVIVWLQGQPGWSSLVGLFEEHGPYQVVETDTGIQFELREHAWTNEFNVLYLDHCIGCGYSTAMRRAAYEPTFEMVSGNVYQALVQFFGVFSEYADNEVYLAGEHGCAKYIPVIADTIHSKNIIQEEQINLRGILIGGPYIDAVSMTGYSEYLYVTGLIDEEEQENLFIQEQYAKSLILAAKYNETITFLKENVYTKFEQAGYQRLYDLRYEKPMNGHYTFERYMQKVIKYEPFVSSIHAEGLEFRTQSELLNEEIMKPVDNILTTILNHYKVLYYNGQFDMLTPYCLTARYFSQLHWAHTDLFYSRQLNNWDATNSGYPDGYWKFSSNLTHVMIRDAGHTVGTTKPLTLLFMLRWLVSDMFETSYAPPSPDQRYLNIFI